MRHIPSTAYHLAFYNLTLPQDGNSLTLVNICNRCCLRIFNEKF